eukprot:TRINITY_DN10258_c0_g1_i5.p1 TRINITY_DN10258_c0_g1~~TRINITY_DN10258_c0_g1_i5.p1  ORF type:complete len:103 (-),score=15.84 TRINITY_DN10258_c0_g1_i5:232-540(-)
MRTRDGHNIPNDSRDLQFLVETGIRAPDALLHRSDVFSKQEVLDQAGVDVYKDQAVTFYSAGQGKTNMCDTTYGRRGTADYKKSSSFSKPIEDHMQWDSEKA